MTTSFKSSFISFAEELTALIVGGWDVVNGYGKRTTEIVSQRTNCSTSSFPPLPVGIDEQPSLILTSKEEILLCGGRPNQKCLELKNGQWQDHSKLKNKRWYSAAVYMPEGIFIFGGEGSRSSITWEWLPSGTNQWQNGNTIIPGYGLREDCAVNIDDTNILLIGGGKTNKRVLKFNTNTKEFTNLGDVLNEGRYGHACQVFKNKIIISGGYRPGKYLDSTEIINLNDLTTAYTAGSLVQAREFHGLAVVHVDNKPTFLAFGGYAYNEFFDSIEMWNPTTETWTMTSMKISEPKAGFGFLSLPTRLLCP